ncbi:glutaredoxin 3 [Geothermobacter hydrogeniphilus]|uniref:Glutaredoxin n=1 Tax=Geothermobacter hydrogeniphilus TaxID=1969733 RepID=A0A1X0YAS5_9BACT|nr:glutaredoxin 3 [Geothermobacter hydrogeniphilus]ORJ62216.1 glutaredoxin 3 [Geothermobacter hydrogeniphilus]
MSSIEIYTRNYCPYCRRAKELLKIKGVDFVEYEISDDPEKEQEMVQRSERRTVPQIFINGSGIGGCDELFTLDERGELDAILRAETLS